jgi:glutathione S-transferase
MGGETITQAARDKFKEACEFANENVKKTGYAAETDNLTLADLAFVSSYSSMVVMDHVDMGPYPELVAWFDKVKKEIKNYDEANGKGAQIYGDMFNAMLKKANQK